MDGLEFTADVVKALAWPATVATGIVVLRGPLGSLVEQLGQRVRHVNMPFGSVEFHEMLSSAERGIEAAQAPHQDAGALATPSGAAGSRSDWDALRLRAVSDPHGAVIAAWARLELDLNWGSDCLGTAGARDWPSVDRALQALPSWPQLRSVVVELRGLRELAIRSPQSPNAEDALRYVTVAEGASQTLRADLDLRTVRPEYSTNSSSDSPTDETGTA